MFPRMLIVHLCLSSTGNCRLNRTVCRRHLRLGRREKIGSSFDRCNTIYQLLKHANVVRVQSVEASVCMVEEE